MYHTYTQSVCLWCLEWEHLGESLEGFCCASAQTFLSIWCVICGRRVQVSKNRNVWTKKSTVRNNGKTWSVLNKALSPFLCYELVQRFQSNIFLKILSRLIKEIFHKEKYCSVEFRQLSAPPPVIPARTVLYSFDSWMTTQ